MTKRTEPKWGKRLPAQRGRWGTFLVWQRFLHGELTQDNVLDMLDKMGSPMSGAYYSDMENGVAPVNEQWQEVFRRMWNAEPEPEQQEAPTSSSDIGALVTRLDRQADVIDRLAGALEAATALNAQTLRLLDAAVRALAGGQLEPAEPIESAARQ